MGSNESRPRPGPTDVNNVRIFTKSKQIEIAKNIEFYSCIRALFEELTGRVEKNNSLQLCLEDLILANAVHDEKYREMVIEKYQQEYKQLTGELYIPFRKIWHVRMYGDKAPSDAIRKMFGETEQPIYGLKGHREKDGTIDKSKSRGKLVKKHAEISNEVFREYKELNLNQYMKNETSYNMQIKGKENLMKQLHKEFSLLCLAVKKIPEEFYSSRKFKTSRDFEQYTKEELQKLVNATHKAVTQKDMCDFPLTERYLKWYDESNNNALGSIRRGRKENRLIQTEKAQLSMKKRFQGNKEALQDHLKKSVEQRKQERVKQIESGHTPEQLVSEVMQTNRQLAEDSSLNELGFSAIAVFLLIIMILTFFWRRLNAKRTVKRKRSIIHFRRSCINPGDRN